MVAFPTSVFPEAVSLSPSACLARLRRLEKEEVITGYKAQVDAAKLGPNLTVFAEIVASAHDLGSTRKIKQALAEIPEAVEAYQVSGSYDFLVRFLVPDMEFWTNLADELADGELKIETVRTVACHAPYQRMGRCSSQLVLGTLLTWVTTSCGHANLT